MAFRRAEPDQGPRKGRTDCAKNLTVRGRGPAPSIPSDTVWESGASRNRLG